MEACAADDGIFRTHTDSSLLFLHFAMFCIFSHCSIFLEQSQPLFAPILIKFGLIL